MDAKRPLEPTLPLSRAKGEATPVNADVPSICDQTDDLLTPPRFIDNQAFCVIAAG
jgi:hypothetical protein